MMAIGPNVTKEDVKMLNQDIRFIKTKSFKAQPINYFIARSPWYYLSYILLAILFATAIMMHKRLTRQNADVAGLRLRKADKFARKRLKKSEGLLKQGKDAAFYEELLGAIWGYLSDKLKIPVASLSKDSALSALQKKAVNPEIMEQLFKITDACEMARYSGISGDFEKNGLYREALTIITTLQQKIKSSSNAN
jgi:hypothetical protein